MKLRVFMYHKLGHQADFLTVTPEQFEQQMQFIRKHFTPIRLSDLIQHLEHQSPLPEKAALITFDDGYENNYLLAYPILKQHQIPFAVFLVANYIGKEVSHDEQLQGFMDQKQLLSMQDLAEYACHSTNHQNIQDIPETAWSKEISDCYRLLQETGITVQPAWAYTYGAFPRKNPERFEQLKRYFEHAGIQCAFRIGNRINRLPIKNPFAIERIDVRGDQSFWRFKLKVGTGKLF